MIETNRFFLQKEGINTIGLGITGDPMGSENVKNGRQYSGSSPPPSSMGVPPPWAHNFLHHGYLNSVSCRFQHILHTSHNEETYEMIFNLMYNFIPKCVHMHGNLSTATQMTQRHIF